MARLKDIFIEVQTSDIEKARYYASKVHDSLMINEGLLDSKFSLDDIEDVIFLEAIRCANEIEAIKFIESIKHEFIAEGFVNSAIKAANWVTSGIKKIVHKVKDWFAGPIKTAFGKFYNTIAQPAMELKNKGIVEADESANTIETPKSNNKITTMLTNVAAMRPKFGNTGALSTHLKKYTTEKINGSLILNIGDVSETNTLLVYNKTKSALYINLSDTIVQDTKDLKYIVELIDNIKNNGIFETGIENITLNGKTIQLTANKTNINVTVGSYIIIPIDSKKNSPLKKVAISTNDDFLKQSTSANIEDIQSNTNLDTLPSNQWIGKVINESGIKKLDETLIKSLGIDTNLLWSNFSKFSKKNQDDIVNILLQVNDGGNYAPMSNNEFIAFSTTLTTLLGYIWNQIKKGKIDSQVYDATLFNNFIVVAYKAAVELNKVINANIKVSNSENNASNNDKVLEELKAKIMILNTTQIEQLKKSIGL